MPITRSGRSVDRGERRDRDRRRVRGEHRAVRQQPRRRARKTSSFTAASSIDRLDHQVGGDELVDGVDARRAPRPGRRRPSPRASRGSSASPRARARSRPGAASWSETRRPEAATTCAMPPPICPAPTTRTCSKSMREELPRPASRMSDCPTRTDSSPPRSPVRRRRRSPPACSPSSGRRAVASCAGSPTTFAPSGRRGPERRRSAGGRRRRLAGRRVAAVGGGAGAGCASCASPRCGRRASSRLGGGSVLQGAWTRPSRLVLLLGGTPAPRSWWSTPTVPKVLRREARLGRPWARRRRAAG